MSYVLPPTYVGMHKKHYESMPRSIQIQMDNTSLFPDLNHIQRRVKEEKDHYKIYHEYSYRHIKPITRIINVYNDNVNYVNKEVEKFIPFQKRTFEQYLQGHPNSTLEDYESDEGTRYNNFKEENFEVAELFKLTPILQTIHQNITRVIGKLYKYDGIDPHKSLPSLRTVIDPERYPAFFNFTELRRVEAPIQEDSVSESSESDELETIDVTVPCNLKFGQTLAICCEPNWGQEPIAFASSENGWKGQVPVNTSWKFVILENGNVTKWEQGDNRYSDGQTLTVQAHEVKF